MKFIIFLLFILKYVQSAKILVIIPTPSYSHQIAFRSLWTKLHSHGHHLTILTTDPFNDKNYPNITEIDMHFLYKIYKNYDFVKVMMDCENGMLNEHGLKLHEMVINATEALLELPEVKNLIRSEDEKFDLLLVEAQYPSMISFSWKFDCPFIFISSMDGSIPDHFLLGNSIHPDAFPDYNLRFSDLRQLTFFERLTSFFYTNMMLLGYNGQFMPEEWERMKKHFGDDLPDLKELQKNLSAIFVNNHLTLGNLRATVPNTIQIGDGMHILPPKPLPKDLKEFLDSGSNGVIYFSLGSNIKSDVLSNDTINAILAVWRELPQYKVLWKIDIDSFTDLPKNVKVIKWAPQQDVLRHPNIILFINQGGLQSLQEGLSFGIPMICIPHFGDQFYNVQRVVKHEVAIQLDYKNITKDNIQTSIVEILNNPRYKKKMEEVSKLFHDVPMSGLEQAVWWTEYIIRHKGVPHLRSPVIDMPILQYFCLDIILLIISILLLIFYVIIKILIAVIRKCSRKSIKVKVN